MWKIFFMCYGLYCETGQDLGWHVDQRFQTQAECEQFGRDVMEFVGPAPPKGMRVDPKCVEEDHT